MKHEIDLKKYQIRTDLITESIDSYKGLDIEKETIDNIKITKVHLDGQSSVKLHKKVGDYITIEFEDVTDQDNQKQVLKVFQKELEKLLTISKISNLDSCLMIGLGNDKSTPDSLGPITISDVLVTRHLFMLSDVEEGFREVSAFIPGVTGNTGIETSDLITSVVEKVKPDFVIVVDALASASIERVNKTIQMSNTGIHPGSGVGNSRKELSRDTIGIPVIAIGIPTVVDAVSVVSDTINYMHKHYAFNKKFLNDPLSRVVSSRQVNYLKKDIQVEEEDKTSLLGLIGSLTEPEVRQLISEVLTPIGYNLMVTPKEIDFVIDKLGYVLSEGINRSLHPKYQEKN